MGESRITTETIAAAEQVVGIEYDEDERRQMLAGIGGQTARTELRRGYMPDNGFGPAVVFDPRLPGMVFPANDGGVVPSGAPVPRLPDD
ncbi:MAG: hypothetical protein VCD33_13815, partial [Alphaproteobacteria bacterium]